ncbi:hypothetical protein [Pseudofrankia saprophytica]|nr:hypothetical protein [Pseudofrankia saprophytica]
MLLDRIPDIALAIPSVSLLWRPTFWVRGLAELPVIFTPA